MVFAKIMAALAFGLFLARKNGIIEKILAVVISYLLFSVIV